MYIYIYVYIYIYIYIYTDMNHTGARMAASAGWGEHGKQTRA